MVSRFGSTVQINTYSRISEKPKVNSIGLRSSPLRTNGIGISAEDLPQVFERLYRADKSRTAADGRTRPGLAICKAIVEADGGSIAVSSQLGAGSTFTARMPELTHG
jgi:signal transduction histidine kinase